MSHNPAQVRQLADGRIELENDCLCVRLDPQQAGSAVSIVDKKSGKDVAICQGYGTRIHPALFEILAGQSLSEGRVDAVPQPYDVRNMRVGETGAATVTMSGHPVAGPGATPLHRVRLDKTCRLAPNQFLLQVDLAFVNESGGELPLAAWISSGVRITDEDCDVFAPSITGTIQNLSLWHAPMSMSTNIPRAAGGWTAAVARNASHLGIYLAAPDNQVDAIWNWLGKFHGFTLGFGTPQVMVQPGGVLRISYVFGILRGLARIDGATAAMAGAIDLDDRNVVPDQTRPVTVHLTAPEARTATVTLARRSSDTGSKAAPIARLQVDLEPDHVTPVVFDVPFETEDTFALTATVKSGSDILRMERPLTVGIPKVLYRRPLPRLAGSRFWGQFVGDRPLKSRTQRCDRSVKHPMVPWLTPSAERRLKVFFIGEVSFNLAIYRDLARRGDFEWDFVNVWGTGDMRTGPYGKAEIDRARRKLRRFKPDCILTAGLRYEDTPAGLIEDLWHYARKGGGLLIIGRDEPCCHGIWPGRLASQAQAEPLDHAAPLRSLFDSGVAPGPMGALHAFRAGQGRIIMLDKQLDWPALGPRGDAAPRNDLLPRYRGKTELPDWEYHFAQYLRLIRHAARITPAATLDDVILASDALTIKYRSSSKRKTCLEYEIVSSDRLLARRGQANIDLVSGAGTLAFALALLPANEYIIHAWILDGAGDRPVAVDGDARLILREGHERPVIDFIAACQTLTGALRLEKIDVAGRRQAVPGTVTVSVSGNPELLGRADVEVEWRNGEFDRVVWRRREPLAGRKTAQFKGIAFTPVSHAGAVAVRLWDGDRIIAEHAETIAAWKPGNTADDDMAFFTAAGGEHDWYGTRMMQPWAEREAGFDFTYLRYGLEGGSFPWKRERDNKLDPPIVDEEPLRNLLAGQFKHEFEELGHAYLNMADEFRLGGEYDWSEPTLQFFRQRLAALYGRIENLNAQWDSDFTNFDAVMPILLAEARMRPDNPSPWIDFRLFMDARVNRRYEIASEEAAKLSPLFRVGDSGAYAPGMGVGINYFTMIQASGFTMTYGGLRSDWVRSFLKEGDIVGVWLGYGWAGPILPWETLFRHYNILAWWGYLLHKRLTAHGDTSVIHLDLTPTPQFRKIGRQQREIRNGLGKLLMHARVAPARALIPYSQASVYANAVLGEPHEDGANAATVLFNERRLTYRFIADEQVLAGVLNEAADAFFILPNVDAMPTDAARAYGAAVARGCFALADATAGTRDGHGKRLLNSPLDIAFGVNRAQGVVLKATRFEPIRWTGSAPAELRGESGQMVRAMRGIQAADGAVWARFEDGEPAIIAATSPAGSLAVMFNTRLPWVSSNKVEKALNPEDRPDELSPNQTVGRIFDHLLRRAGLLPHAGVESETLTPRMISRFDDDRARYYGIVLGESAGRMTVTLPETAYTYDARSGRYFGCVNRVEDTVKDTQLAAVYAQLPYAVRGLRARVTPQPAHPGDTVTLTGHIIAENGKDADQFHVVHAEVVDPRGNRPAFHQHNLGAPQGLFEMTIPLAMNASEGIWRIELRDTATGKRRAVGFTVTIG